MYSTPVWYSIHARPQCRGERPAAADARVPAVDEEHPVILRHPPDAAAFRSPHFVTSG
jgi:hypothetical protein